VPRTRTTKKLAQRIDLNYFQRPSALRRWRLWLSVAAPALALAWLVWYGSRGDARVYSAGRLSAAHAVLSQSCAACHVTKAGVFLERAADQQCSRCHDGALHHATQTFTPSCGACHMEHRGAVRLAATNDANCTQCHANLSTLAGATSFVRNIRSFAGDHPEFAVIRAGRGNPGTIQLNHFRHLQPNLLGPNGPVQLVCTDCHRSAAEAGQPWAYGDAASRAADAGRVPPGAMRAYMAPATFAHTCAACHSLQFDKRFAEPVPHGTPEVIRTFVVARFQSYIATHPAELRVPRDPSRDLPERAIPSDYRVLSPPQWVAEKTAEAEQLLWRKTCKQCHTLDLESGAPLPVVAPSNITSRFMPRAKFDHAKHEGFACASCHAGATTSQQSSDLLVPGIATCRTCHHPGVEAAESRCFECHTYHDPTQRKIVPGGFILSQLERGKTAVGASKNP